MIRAIVSDFGGVLTTPLSGSFQGFADQSGGGDSPRGSVDSGSVV